MIRECVIYSTSRSIREAISYNEDGFLPDYLTMGEFLERSVLSSKLFTPDQDLRLLALHQACTFDSFSSLKIERNFFSFIHNSEYIFRLFEELSAEQVNVESLFASDIYGEYEEHLSILKELHSRYQKIVEANGWKDPIYSKSNFKINTQYIKRYDKIVFHIDGYLSRFEMDVLTQIAQVINVHCVIALSPYNTKMQERFSQIGIDLVPLHTNIIDLSTKQVLDSKALDAIEDIVCETVSQRIEEIGFIEVKIAQMVQQGIKPEKIVVVVPDEGFVPYMERLNPIGNLNFAMGKSLKEDSLLKMIEAVERFVEEQSEENRLRMEKIPVDLSDWIKNFYSRKFTPELFENFYSLLDKYCQSEEIREIIKEEHDRFKTLYSAVEGMEFRSVMKIFMNRLQSRSIDDVGGGKITVMGVLETRGMEYDGVIVIDFNEGSVPRKSQKDMFLNSQTRKMAGLPTPLDRESLQKHYYWMLFSKAKSVSLCCVANNENVPSRFLLQMGISIKQSEFDYSRVLFDKEIRQAKTQNIAESEYDFTIHPVSASSLKSFLTCKRQFYYKYVQKLKEHKMVQDLYEEREIGNKIHAALQKVYVNQSTYSDKNTLRETFKAVFATGTESDVMERYLNTLWIEKMEPFYENEASRFDSGTKVAYCEKEFSAECEGVTLIGRVDRVDYTPQGLEVLDYKSGKYPSTTSEPKDEDTDYQLSIYAILVQELGNVKGCGYYDLNRGVIDFEAHLDAKVEKLREILGSMASQRIWSWDQCEDFSACRYCAYSILCQREL